MKPFSLEEYIKNPERKVVTRDRRAVKIHCTDYLGVQPIFATIEGDAYPSRFCKNGRYIDRDDSHLDLFFAPEKKKGWVNVYKNEYGAYVLGEIFIGKEHEEVTTGLTYITTAKIEWEE